MPGEGLAYVSYNHQIAVMKTTLTLATAGLLACSTWAAISQTVLPPTYPFNPDSDGDAFVAVSDVLSSVAAYDNEFEASPMMVDTLTLEQAIQILLQRQAQNQQDLIDGLSNSLSGVDGFDPCLLQWTCGCPVEHNGHSYSTVQIGDQCWFAENCRYLPSVSPSTSTLALGDPNMEVGWVYDYEGADVDSAMATSYYQEHGALYTWAAATQWDLCPSGWHVSSDSDWLSMESFIGIPEEELEVYGQYRGDTQGTELKSLQGWPAGEEGSDMWGFGALPSGGRGADSQGCCYGTGFGEYTAFWTTTSNTTFNSWYRQLAITLSGVFRKDEAKWVGYSVRCVQDAE